MDPVSILIVALIIGWGITRIPRAIADTAATAKAATAGRFGLIEADRRRKAAARQKWADWFRQEWTARRERRQQQRGDSGEVEPGLWAYFREQYHAWWQDRINNARTRRDARAPYDPNGTGWAARWYERMKAAYRKRYGTDPQPTTQVDSDPAGSDASGETGGQDSQQPTDTSDCPSCGEPLTDEPPRWWRPRQWGPPPNRSHRNREPYCDGTEGVVHDTDEPPAPPFGGCFRCGRPTQRGGFFCTRCLIEEADRQAQEARQGAASAGAGSAGPEPTPQPTPHASESDCTCSSCGKTDADVLYSTPDCAWECSDCADRRAGTTNDNPSAADQPGPADTTAAEPTGPHAVPTTQGDTTMTQALVPTSGGAPAAAEVAVNEHLRANFQQMIAGARRLAEAAAMAEQARQDIQAAAEASADGVSVKKFDSTATAAATDVAAGVNLDTLVRWCALAEALEGAAQAGHDSLEKYRDAEDTVASNNVDGSTLDSAAA